MMSKYLIYLTALIVFGCNNIEPETEEDRRRNLIANEWQVIEVTDDAGTSQFAGDPGDVIVTFTQNNFTVNTLGLELMPNKNNALFASGSWRFANEALNQVILDDGNQQTTINIVNINENSFTFTYTGAEPKASDTFTATVQMIPAD